MNKAVLYFHGMGGRPQEAAHYRFLFPDCDVTGIRYRAKTPWEAKEEFPNLVKETAGSCEAVILIGVSLGAYFAMHALADFPFQQTFLISPVTDMEGMILRIMKTHGISEEELRQKKEITVSSGETLSFRYLSYVREHPLRWNAPAEILYGEKDMLVPRNDAEAFAKQTGAGLTVMKDGEHWFHTEEQMRFLDEWITKHMPAEREQE